MWSRGGPRSSVLDRAKAHLSGQRISNPAVPNDKGDERGPAMVAGRIIRESLDESFEGRWANKDLSDVSSPSQTENRDPVKSFSMGGGSRFLKKTSIDTTEGKTPAGTDELKVIPQRSSQSAALSRLALIESRFRKQKSSSNHTEPQEKSLSVQSNSDLSMTGSRFLKKIVSEPEEQKVPETSPGPNEYKERSVSLDSDEQDIRRLIGDSFSLSESSLLKSLQSVKKLNKKSEKFTTLSVPEKRNVSNHQSLSPSPRRPESRMVSDSSVSSEKDHSEIHSLDDLFPAVAAAPDSEDTISERSAAYDDFKLNVMTLDDLAPLPFEDVEISQEKTEKQAEKEHRSNMSSKISKNASQPISEEAYESDFESEIASDIIQSASEISEHLTDEDKEVSLDSEAQYSSDKSQEEDEGEERTLSQSSISSSGNLNSSSKSSSSDVTVTRGPSSKHNAKEAAVQTQMDGFAYTWSSGMAAAGPSLGMKYVDPTPIASHTVSAEAIETLTSYSPAIFALNDMLRQQLGLTRAFIASQRHHYMSVLESLGPADYKYTTLQDTKEFIRAHKPPKMSLRDAQEEVLQEMKDYRYI